MLWFHPHARLIASKLSLAREMVVDEMTILITRDRRAYAEALLAFSNPQPHVIGVTPFIGRRTLSQRISLIAEEASMSRRRAMSSAAIALDRVHRDHRRGSRSLPDVRDPAGRQSEVHQPGQRRHPSGGRHGGQTRLHARSHAAADPGLGLAVVRRQRRPATITDIEVTRSLDTEFGLDQAAIDAARQWKFRPGRKDGKAVAVRITIELTFTLQVATDFLLFSGQEWAFASRRHSPRGSVHGSHHGQPVARSLGELHRAGPPGVPGLRGRSRPTASSSTQSTSSAPPPDFLLGRPRGSIGVRGSMLVASANSDIYDFVTDVLAIEKSDFNTGSFARGVWLSASRRVSTSSGRWISTA